MLESHIEDKVFALGSRLLTAMQRHSKFSGVIDRWLNRFLERVMEDEAFRVQALRFVDVLPTLEDDQELTRHLYEYFGEEDFPLAGVLKFGMRHSLTGVTSTLVARTVRKAMEGLARRFVGGANAREALLSAHALWQRNLGFSLDLLGEAVVSEAEADRYQQSYLELLNQLPQQLGAWPSNTLLDRRDSRTIPRLNVSLKLSCLYSQINHLDPDGSVEGIALRLRPILRAARKNGAFICIDMEQFELKEITLTCFKRLLMEPEFRDWPDVGIALQAYLIDTEADLRELIDWAKVRGTPVTVRLVRGAYWDYETVVARRQGWPVPVWDTKPQTDACYERCMRLLFESYPYVEAAFGTHNVRSIALAMVLAEELGWAKDQFEFQVLYGMGRSLEGVIPEMGHRLRVYLPFGELLPGMAYLVRRLLENASSQSFQRMTLSRRLAPSELLSSPHGVILNSPRSSKEGVLLGQQPETSIPGIPRSSKMGPSLDPPRVPRSSKMGPSLDPPRVPRSSKMGPSLDPPRVPRSSKMGLRLSLPRSASGLHAAPPFHGPRRSNNFEVTAGKGQRAPSSFSPLQGEGRSEGIRSPGASLLNDGSSPFTSPRAPLSPSTEKESRTPRSGPALYSATAISEFHNEPLHRFTEETERKAFQNAINRVRRELNAIYPLQIDGQPIDTGQYLISVNPAHPEEIIGRVAKAELSHADQAVTSALRAFSHWGALSMAERADFLLRAASMLCCHRDEFAALEILEAGKTWSEADANVTEAIDYLEYYAREALRLGVGQDIDVPGETNAYFYRPRGIGLIVPPWNFPLAILTGMLSAAIVAGNTVILKPSSQTPVIAARFVSLLQQAGLPPGVVQFLPGSGSTVGEYLVQHPQIHFIAFTGSEEVGTRINRLAAEIQPGQRHVKHVIAEMGGKNAIIIDSDADLDDAVVGVVHSAFGYQGQKCSACSRVIVVRRYYDRFLERLVEATRSLKIGPPEDPGVFLGPVIEEAAKQRINAAIERGKSSARLVLYRECPDLGAGFFVGPAIFSEVPPDSFLAQQEIFGPVLSVMRASDIDEAIALANNTVYALTGGIYSRSPTNIEKARREFQVGNLYINRKITGALVQRQPFGGFKLSGVGSKAGGPDYLLQFLIPCTITENTLRRGFAPNPRRFKAERFSR